MKIEDFFQKDIFDGEYAILTQKGTLNIKMSGFNKNDLDSYFLVSFTAAVSNRNLKKGPFYSGMGLSKELDIPILAIADPSVDMGINCGIGWYAGNHQIPNLSSIINEVIVSVSKKYSLTPLLIGGSAGGYASLVQASIIPIPAKILIWNPQTDLTKYIRKYLLDYLVSAYPNKFNVVEDIKSESLLLAFLRENIPFYSVIDQEIPSNVEVLFLQNFNDWHLISHTLPYFKKNIERLSNSAFKRGSVGLLLGNWGKEHATPPKGLIINIIKSILKGYNSVEIISDMSENEPFFQDEYFSLSYLKNFCISYKLIQGEGKKNIEVLINDKAPNSDVECAVYFLKGSERIKVTWYQRINLFEVPDDCDAIQIFIRNSVKEIEQKFFILNSPCI